MTSPVDDEPTETGAPDRLKNPELLYGRCGAFCGSCARFHGRPAAAAARFLAIVEGSGLGKALTEERYQAYPPQVGVAYREAKRHLTVLQSWFTCWGCAGGGGPRECEIRRCCTERGYKVCFECPELVGEAGPCALFEQGWLEACNVRPSDLSKNHALYKELGLEGWVKHEMNKIDVGWGSTRAALRRAVDTIVAEIGKTGAEVERQLAGLETQKGPSDG